MVPAEAILAEGVGESNYQASERFRFSVAKRGWICNGASSFPFQGFPLDAWSGPPLAWRGSVDQSFSQRFSMFTQCSNTVFLQHLMVLCSPLVTVVVTVLERWQDCLKEAFAFAFEPMGRSCTVRNVRTCELRSKWLKTTVVLQKHPCQRCARNTVKRYGPLQKR